MVGLLKRIGAFVIVTLGSAFGGFVLSKLWAWFVVPQFDVRPLSLVNAVGLHMVVGTLGAPQLAYLATLKERAEHVTKGGTSVGYSAILSIALVLSYSLLLLVAWGWTLLR